MSFFNMNYMMSFFSLRMKCIYIYPKKKEKYKKALSTRIFLLKKSTNMLRVLAH